MLDVFIWSLLKVISERSESSRVNFNEIFRKVCICSTPPGDSRIMNEIGTYMHEAFGRRILSVTYV